MCPIFTKMRRMEPYDRYKKRTVRSYSHEVLGRHKSNKDLKGVLEYRKNRNPKKDEVCLHV